MSHEPECRHNWGHYADCPDDLHECDCTMIRAGYKRGREDAAKAIEVDLAKNGEAYAPDHWHCCFRENAISAARGGEQE